MRFAALLLLLSRCHAIPLLKDQSDYSFEQFVVDFDRSYVDSEEAKIRKALFQANLQSIVQHNNDEGSSGWTMGINQFADRSPDELHTGYHKYLSRPYQTAAVATATQRRRLDEQEVDKLPMEITDVSDLPDFVDWRTHGVTTPIKNQGMCGSCWAFASTAVLESHIALRTGALFELSPQEFVSCTPNTQHCGGSGGCAGSTADLAFETVKNWGMVEEWTFGYRDARGGAFNCSLAQHTVEWENKTYYRGAVAGIADYAVLPSNNYTILMNAVAKLGPVTVSVACMPWMLYRSGVFYAPLTPGKATDVDHLVVVEGYGTDQDTGEDYWLVRNSWGPLWGEDGYIRLRRVGEDECGLDEDPGDGTACTLDPDGNEITPDPQTICGNSGILFDSAVPLGGYLIGK